MDESVDASQVQVWGSGLEPGKVRAGVPLTFHVDGSKAGKARLGVDIATEKGEQEGTLGEEREGGEEELEGGKQDG